MKISLFEQARYRRPSVYFCDVNISYTSSENIYIYTVNLGVLPQHQNRCKFLQLCGHRFGAYTELSVNLPYLMLSDIVVWTPKLCK